MITRGTTPTITYTFDLVDVSNITTAYLTITQGERVIIEKTLNDAEIGENSLVWTLTQDETLQLEEDASVKIQCRYKTGDGMAYATKKTTTKVYGVEKEGVI